MKPIFKHSYCYLCYYKAISLPVHWNRNCYVSCSLDWNLNLCLSVVLTVPHFICPTVVRTHYLNLKVNITCSDGKLLSESNSTAYFLASSQLKGGDDSFLQSQVHRVHRQVHTVHNNTLYSLLSSFTLT